MHVATTLYVVFAVWRWGDWRNWEKYHTTMLYFALGNLLYNFLTAHYFLWRLDADFLSNHTLTEMLYTFIVFPGTALLFLCNMPEEKRRRNVHIVKWIFIYALWEAFFVLTKSIEYQYGWGYWWSVGFDTFMFPMLLLHYKKPLIAYLLSIPIGIFFIWWFNVPVHLPIEQR
ncbi:CBO0543 family protein [Salinibacillus xinjiangensis]|uniref:Uncharacterized protein n=1 Tax=Salinibacillus xinjiangensis TaxID=1229268 RepID=A0A6G1X861_9BACI|nr:CBO0543 family protein [Salinibacillus xinjiangensis]MRG87119.1 hypothetical protein [Salinibacillus xinjiangensis]